MSIVVPDVGETLLLRYMLNHTAATNVRLRLYVNNKTPSESDVLGSYTEAVDGAYSNTTLTGTNWVVTTTAGISTAFYTQQEFSFSGSTAVYGYFITDNSGANLLMAERFDGAPFNIPTGGGVIAIDPTITLD